MADRSHFLRAASAVMRHLLVDHARQREAAKRGGGLRPLMLTDSGPSTEDDSVAVIALDHALRELSRIDPRLEQVMSSRPCRWSPRHRCRRCARVTAGSSKARTCC